MRQCVVNLELYAVLPVSLLDLLDNIPLLAELVLDLLRQTENTHRVYYIFTRGRHQPMKFMPHFLKHGRCRNCRRKYARRAIAVSSWRLLDSADELGDQDGDDNEQTWTAKTTSGASGQKRQVDTTRDDDEEDDQKRV